MDMPKDESVLSASGMLHGMSIPEKKGLGGACKCIEYSSSDGAQACSNGALSRVMACSRSTASGGPPDT